MQRKEIKREITNWDNDLTSFLLKRLSPSELDIFLGICYRWKRQRTRTAKITFDELRELSYFSTKDNERFQDRILAVNKKLSSLSFEINDGSVYYGFSFFSMYKINTNNEYIEIIINEHLAYLLNDFEKNYTSMEMFKHKWISSPKRAVLFYANWSGKVLIKNDKLSERDTYCQFRRWIICLDCVFLICEFVLWCLRQSYCYSQSKNSPLSRAELFILLNYLSWKYEPFLVTLCFYCLNMPQKSQR